MNHPIPALVPVRASQGPATVAPLADVVVDDRSTNTGFRSVSMWAPVLAAILLDIADVLSFGPQGLFIGTIAGSALGWRIAAASGFSSKGRLVCAALAAIYCIMPFTEILPVATMLTTASRVMSALSLVRRFRGA